MTWWADRERSRNRGECAVPKVKSCPRAVPAPLSDKSLNNTAVWIATQVRFERVDYAVMRIWLNLRRGN